MSLNSHIVRELSDCYGLSRHYGMKLEASTQQDLRGIRIVVSASKGAETAYSVAVVDHLALTAAPNMGGMLNLLGLTLEACAKSAAGEVKRKLHKRGRVRCFCVECMGRRLRERGRWDA